MNLEAIYQLGQRVQKLEERMDSMADSVRHALREVVKTEEALKETNRTVRQEIINKEADSLTIGTPTNGQFKVYGDLSDTKAVKKKIDNALACLGHAQKKNGGGGNG